MLLKITHISNSMYTVDLGENFKIQAGNVTNFIVKIAEKENFIIDFGGTTDFTIQNKTSDSFKIETENTTDFTIQNKTTNEFTISFADSTDFTIQAGLVASISNFVNEFVPYTGANKDLDLGVYNLLNYEKTPQLNTRDTNNRDRSNHTGTQAISTITNLQTELNTKQDTLLSGINIKTINNQSLLGSGNIDISGGSGGSTNLTYTASPTQGQVNSDTGTDAIIPPTDGTNAGLFLPAEKIKLTGIQAGAEVNVNADWNSVSGDSQILNKPTIITNHTALSNIGTNTHAQIDTHIASTSNPHSVTKTQVGLSNVDNTSDANKPISTATQTALNTKQDALLSGTNIKTINSISLLGSGNIDISGGSAEQTFETVSKNLKAYPATFNYTTGTLTSIVYTLPVGTITKTLNYTTGTLTSIVLSGNTPSGIDLTKTLVYSGGIITSITYS